MEGHFSLYLKRFFSGTLLSRVTGLGRDLAMAFAFGDHPSVAAFMVAFRLSNLFRRLLGEGPLQSAFIPYFEGLRVEDGAKAAHFFRRIVVLISLIVCAITILTEGGIALFLGLEGISEGAREIMQLTGWLFPGLLFICLYGLNIALLNCYDSFFIPSVAPSVCNVIWIFAALFLRNQDPHVAMIMLSKSVLIGFLGQWLLTLPLTLRYVGSGWREWLHFEIPPEVRKLVRSFSFGALGVGAVQINAFADAIFARFADVRGPVYLWYSIRLEQLALAIFGIACVSTIVPRLSRAIKSRDNALAETLFYTSYKRILTIMIPCTFAIAALGLSAVDLVYGHGHFSDIAVLKTTLCLIAYGTSLIPTTLIILYSAVFYAHDNFRLPMLVSVFSVVLSLVLNAFFVFSLGLGAISVALATSVSAWVNSYILARSAAHIGWKTDYSTIRALKVVAACACAFLVTLMTDFWLFESNILQMLRGGELFLPPVFLRKCVEFCVLSFIFLSSFLAYAGIFKNGDILELLNVFSFRKKQPEVLSS